MIPASLMAALAGIVGPAPVAPVAVPAPAVAAGASAGTEVVAPATLQLGVATHFDQNWSPVVIGNMRRAGVATLRDEVRWTKVERKPGVYAFDSFSTSYPRMICRETGLTMLVEVDPRNPLYDDGASVRTPAGYVAFAGYLNALLDNGGGCIRAIEIGNEINGQGNYTLPAGADLAASHAALLSAVAPLVKAKHPDVVLMTGSLHSIAVGTIGKIAAAGGLARIDAIAIHPYRGAADGLDQDLAHLHAVLRAAGADRPVWVTEFGVETDDPATSPPYLLKMATLLSAGGVTHAYWYALQDEPYYRNMGLFGAKGVMKPLGESARMLTRELLGAGPARRLDTGDALTQAFRFGAGAAGGLVLWGPPRPVRFTGSPVFRDAQGRTIAAPERLSDTPFVVSGTFDVTFGADPVLADTRYDHGTARWSYWARQGERAIEPLRLIDWEWTSFYSQPWLNPVQINRGGVILGSAVRPITTILRYTAREARVAALSACFTQGLAGAGIDIVVSHQGREVYRGMLTDRLLIAGPPITLAPGDRVDVSLAARSTTAVQGAALRIRLIDPASRLDPLCE